MNTCIAGSIVCLLECLLVVAQIFRGSPSGHSQTSCGNKPMFQSLTKTDSYTDDNVHTQVGELVHDAESFVKQLVKTYATVCVYV